MDVLSKLKQYLEQHDTPFEVILHEEVYTAQELAQTLHTPGKELIKVVLIKDDGGYCLAALSASRKIDLQTLKTLIGATSISLASEEECSKLFPEAEIGAMPPFGNLYSIAVFADAALTADETITFNAGTHYEAIHMKYRDFERLVRPRIGSFTVPA